MAKQREEAKAAASIRVVVDIKSGPVSPAQLTCWRNFWRRIIAEVNAAEKEGPSGQAPTNDENDGHEEEIPGGIE